MYGRYEEGDLDAHYNRNPKPTQSGTKFRKALVIALWSALEEPDQSPRELVVRFPERRQYFLSEASVCRILKRYDLITSPAYIVMKAADQFATPTTAPNQLWQTDFTYLKVIGWGWFYLSTVRDDYSHNIIAWRLCTSMAASDVAATLDHARKTAGLANWLDDHDMPDTRGKPYHPITQGKIECWHRSQKNPIRLKN